MPGSRTPSPQARRWQWRPSASSSWLQAAGLPSGKVREWGKAGGKAEAVGVLLRGWCRGKGGGGVLGVRSWGRRCVGAMAVGSPAGEAAEGAGELQPSSPSPETGARAGQQLGLRTSATVLLAGACRGRCPRQQHVDSPQTEDTNNGDIQCEYCLLSWGKPHGPLLMGILCNPPCNPTTSFPTGTYKIPARSSRPGFSPAPHVLLLPCMQSAAAACTRDMAASQCSQGQSPFAWGVLSTRAPVPEYNSPTPASAFVLSSVSLQRDFCFKSCTKHSVAVKAVAVYLHCWAKYLIARSETTGSSQGRMLWLGDRL
nr:uncharacterized protein LOC106029498 isoform X2 [Anser cygnoides]